VQGEPYTSAIRAAIRRRYSLLPYWYTLFRQAYLSGAPPMRYDGCPPSACSCGEPRLTRASPSGFSPRVSRPLFYEWPSDTALFDKQDAFMVGPALLVQPVGEAGVTSANVLLPGGAAQVWYDYETQRRHVGGQTVRVDAPLGRTPVFQRGGTIIPRRDRVRRASAMMHHEPLVLVVAVDAQGKAEGRLYLDDGESYAYEAGHFADKLITLASGRLESRDVAEAPASQAAARDAFRAANRVGIERIVLVGLPAAPQAAEVVEGAERRQLEVASSTTRDGTVVVHLKKPVANAAVDWQVVLTL